MNIAILSARDRSAVNGPMRDLSEEEKEKILAKDKELVEATILGLKNKFKQINILSYGCDDGIPYVAKKYCMRMGIKFAESGWFFHGVARSARWPDHETKALYKARHPELLEACDAFVIYTNESRFALVEDMITRLENLVEKKPFIVINPDGEEIGGYKQEMFL